MPWKNMVCQLWNLLSCQIVMNFRITKILNMLWIHDLPRSGNKVPTMKNTQQTAFFEPWVRCIVKGEAPNFLWNTLHKSVKEVETWRVSFIRILHVVLFFVLFKVSPRQVFGVINNYKHWQWETVSLYISVWFHQQMWAPVTAPIPLTSVTSGLGAQCSVISLPISSQHHKDCYQNINMSWWWKFNISTHEFLISKIWIERYTLHWLSVLAIDKTWNGYFR